MKTLGAFTSTPTAFPHRACAKHTPRRNVAVRVMGPNGSPLGGGMGGMGGMGGGLEGMGGGMVPPGGQDVTWDPEGLFGKSSGFQGHIARRQMEKLSQQDQTFAETVAKAENEARKEVIVKRASRIAPETEEDLVEYFLNTEMEEMEYEVARYRPKLTEEFFKFLDKQVGLIRFDGDVDQDRLGELETLRDYLLGAKDALDEATNKTSSAVDRMRKLLMAQDKKAMILEMVAENEVDQPLMDLLDQNRVMAVEAGETQKAEFIEKVRNACARYLVTVSGEKSEEGGKSEEKSEEGQVVEAEIIMPN